MTSLLDVYSPSEAEYENEDIPKIHLTAEEPPWDPLTNEYSEKEPWTVTAERVPVDVSAVISYSLAYDATDVMDHDNLATALSAQIQSR